MKDGKKLELGGALQGRRWEWVSGCTLGWDAGMLYPVLLNSLKNLKHGSA